MKPNITAEEIDAILPQTQCGLCGYPGCMPYAKALANNEATIDLCPPGGVEGLRALGSLLGIDPSPVIPAMEKKAKPKLLAVIREAECIGCTKCINACPVDAILGGPKQMHTIIAMECTGCELCVAPCPVDCIDMIPAPIQNTEDNMLANQYRQRYNARQKRLQNEIKENASPLKSSITHKPTLAEKKSYIEAAILRAKQKK